MASGRYRCPCTLFPVAVCCFLPLQPGRNLRLRAGDRQPETSREIEVRYHGRSGVETSTQPSERAIQDADRMRTWLPNHLAAAAWIDSHATRKGNAD